MIAILGAMQEEILPILDRFESYETIDYANNKFYLTNYAGKEVVVAYSKIGKVNAAITACVMIEKFKATTLLFSGVAGALNADLKIGDLLYATSLVQHDLDISAFGHEVGFVPGIEVFTKSSKELNDVAQRVSKKQNIKLLSGVVATGDQFVCQSDKKDWIREKFNADATEMEGASVAQVCTQLNVPFFILRAISDEAGTNAEFDFDEFLQSSAKISADFILDMVRDL